MENKEMVRDAAIIQRILAKGYHIAVWVNGYGQKNLYLVENGKDPWKGVYLSKFGAKYDFRK